MGIQNRILGLILTTTGSLAQTSATADPINTVIPPLWASVEQNDQLMKWCRGGTGQPPTFECESGRR
jgi:hypothetical protein